MNKNPEGDPDAPWSSPPKSPWPDDTLPRVIEKILQGKRGCLVLDDSTGFHPDRRLWAGVLFDPSSARAALNMQFLFQGMWQAKSGTPTVHFTDLWTGNGPYKGWSVEDRLWPVEAFGGILVESKAHVCVVQASPETIASLQGAGKTLPQLPWFDTTKPDEFALFELLDSFSRSTSVLDPSTGAALDNEDCRISAISDRWKHSEGKLAAVRFPRDDTFLWATFTPPGVLHASVERFPLLQYADLVAWGYSRMERAKAIGKTPNKYDVQLLELLTSISRGWWTLTVTPDGEMLYNTLGDLDGD